MYMLNRMKNLSGKRKANPRSSSYVYIARFWNVWRRLPTSIFHCLRLFLSPILSSPYTHRSIYPISHPSLNISHLSPIAVYIPSLTHRYIYPISHPSLYISHLSPLAVYIPSLTHRCIYPISHPSLYISHLSPIAVYISHLSPIAVYIPSLNHRCMYSIPHPLLYISHLSPIALYIPSFQVLRGRPHFFFLHVSSKS